MYMDLLEKAMTNTEEDNLHNRDAGEFAGICLPQDLTNVIEVEEVHFMRLQHFLMDILCYTIHGISLHWLDFLSGNLIVPNGQGLCYFYWADALILLGMAGLNGLRSLSQ